MDDAKRYEPGVDQPPVGWDHIVPSAGKPPEVKAASMMTDAFLLRAYQRLTGEQGGPEADALLAEIKRRGLGG